MIVKTVLKLEKKRASQVAGMPEKTVIDALEMCAVEVQHGAILSAASMSVQKIMDDFLDKDADTGPVQETAIRTVVKSVLINNLTKALPRENQLMASAATLASNCVKKVDLRQRKKKYQSQKKTPSLPPTPPMLDLSAIDDILFQEKKSRRSRRIKKSRKVLCLSAFFLQDEAWDVTLSSKSKGSNSS